MKENEQDLSQKSFEQILNFIVDKPKQILSETAVHDQNNPHIYIELKQCMGTGKKLTFILEKLEKEFKDSLLTAG